MFYRPAFFLILIPVLDLLGIIYFSGGAFGFLLPLVTTIATGLLGLFLVRRQGMRCWNELNRCLDLGESPAMPLMHGTLIFLGGLLLILPGLITDLIGLLLFVPPIRSLVIVHFRLRFESYRAGGFHAAPFGGKPFGSSPQPPPGSSPDVIDID